MGLIEWRGETLILTLREESNVSRTVSPLLAIDIDEVGRPVRFVFPGAKNYIDDVKVKFVPENNTVEFTFVLKEELPPRNVSVSTYHVMETDGGGRVVRLIIPHARVVIDPKIIEELTTPPSVEETTSVSREETQETVVAEVVEEEENPSPRRGRRRSTG